MTRKLRITNFAIGFLLLSLIFCSKNALAVPAFKSYSTLTQPNGQAFKATKCGDEWFNWTETEDRTVVIKNNDGYWNYAKISSGKLQPTGVKYSPGVKSKDTMKSDLLIESYKKDMIIPKPEGNVINKLKRNNINLIGKLNTADSGKILVIRVGFQDIAAAYDLKNYSDKFFGLNKQSVNDYYSEVSGNKFKFSPATETSGNVNDGIMDVTLPYNHPNTDGFEGSGDPSEYLKIVSDSLKLADTYIDFKQFDTNSDGWVSTKEAHIVFVVAGYEAAYGFAEPCIWAHSSSLGDYSDYEAVCDGVRLCEYNEDRVKSGKYTMQGEIHAIYNDDYDSHMLTIGTLCHELGHDLGLPDLYDYGYDSEGVGIHSIMAGGSWASAINQEPGASPTHMDPWSKIYLGFSSPKLIDISKSSADYTVNSIDKGYNIIKVPTAIPTQYFLIENRQFKRFDSSLASCCVQGGIVVWHIDEQVAIDAANTGTRLNDDQNHKFVDVEEANEGILGYSQLDWNINRNATKYDHYFYKGGNTIFNETSAPNSNLYNGTKTNINIKVNSNPSSSMIVNIKSPDLAPPTIKKTSPAINTKNSAPTVVTSFKNAIITFSENIKPAAYDIENHQFMNISIKVPIEGMPQNDWPSVAAVVSIKGSTLTITPTSPLKSGDYVIVIPMGSVSDLAGNYFDSDPNDGYQVLFNIPDKQGPVVFDTYPSKDAKDAAINSFIGLAFDEHIYINSQKDSAEEQLKILSKITLKGGTKTYKLDVQMIEGFVLIINPIDSNGKPVYLEANTNYTLSVPASIFKDAFGNKNLAYTTKFTTGTRIEDYTENSIDVMNAKHK